MKRYWHKIRDSKCEICDNPIFFLLQRHRKIFGKHGGTYSKTNLADLCPNCHRLIHWLADCGIAALRMQKDVLLKVYSYEQLNKIARFAFPTRWENWDQPHLNINERLAEKYKEE